MITKTTLSMATLTCFLGMSNAMAAPTYLNISNISVAVGAGTSAGSFNNTFANGGGIDKVIDAPSADAEEFHNQTTHLWFTAAQPGGGLELRFDFGIQYNIGTLHFWNYNDESFDVDNVQFSFFNGSNSFVGALSVPPALGSNPAIRAEDIVLAAPLGVRYVTAFLTGTNRQVDFQNIGFTAEVSPAIPEPGTMALMVLGLLGVVTGIKAKSKARGLPDPAAENQV